MKFEIGEEVFINTDRYPNSFNVGDKAKIVGAEDFRGEQSYRVSPLYDNRVGLWLHESEIAELLPKYAVDQTVYATKDVYMLGEAEYAVAGTPGTVVYIDYADERLPYRVRFQDYGFTWCSESEITDEAPVQPLKYALGQTVYSDSGAFPDVRIGTQGEIVATDPNGGDGLPYRVKFQGYSILRWAAEDDITDEAPDTPLKYRVGQTVYVTNDRARVYHDLPEGTPGIVTEVDTPKSIWPYRVAFDGHGEMWLTAESITDEAPEPEYLPVGTEVIVRGVINYVDTDDDELTYRVEFTSGQREWLHAENVQPVDGDEHREDANTFTGIMYSAFHDRNRPEGFQPVDNDEHLNIGKDAAIHPANGFPVGQYGYGVADDEREFSDGDSVVVINKSLGVDAGTVGTFIEYDEDGDCVIQVELGGQYFIKNRDLAHAYPVAYNTLNESSIIATENVRIPGTDVIITKGTRGDFESGNDSYFVARWENDPETWFMYYQDSYVVYE